MTSEPLKPPEEHLPVSRRAKPQYRSKSSFYQEPDAAGRMRAVFLNTQHLTGLNTLSEFINAAIDEKVTALEHAHNDGRPWQPLGAREIPQGKPTRQQGPPLDATPPEKGQEMTRSPEKGLVAVVEKVRRELEVELPRDSGQINVFYSANGLQALVEAYDIGDETSTFHSYEWSHATQSVWVRTSNGTTWEDGGSIPPEA